MKELIFSSRDNVGIKILYYTAERKSAPLLIEIHGGGFTENSAFTDREMCEEMSRKFGVNVASIDYRLAPKCVYPTATYDCADAVSFLCANDRLDFDRHKIAVLGESAGANIAVGVCAVCIGAKIRGQILLYPYLNAKEDKRKRVLASISHKQIKKMNDIYFPKEESRGEFLASPNLGTAEDYKALPPSLVITTGIDTLHSDGIEFVKRLKENGVECTHVDYPKARHGYFENVPNGEIDKWWWASNKSKNIQRECYSLTLEQIKEFLKNIYEG
ncbi:MAG: alpha/beta hydrolase [Ruminococcus flavefaciens]|nr:alpha/beta hydrolase [Ruminococcus flavefaciens]